MSQGLASVLVLKITSPIGQCLCTHSYRLSSSSQLLTKAIFHALELEFVVVVAADSDGNVLFFFTYVLI